MMEALKQAQQVLAELQATIQSTTDDTKLLAAYLKIEKRLKQEVQFLQKKPTTKTNRSSSNLPYLYGVLDVLKQSENVQNVLTDWRKYNIRIDVICGNGKTWKKVVARNPQSLHLIWAGQGQYGSKDVVNTISKYVDAARKESDFSPPDIVCVFTKGVTQEMAEHLETIGVRVEGERVPISDDILRRLQGTQAMLDDSDYSEGSEEYSSDEDAEARSSAFNPPNISTSASDEISEIIALPTDKKIFLDVTTLVIYVSDVCNGGDKFNFKDPTMAEQAEQERTTPVKPFLEQHFNGRQLITCEAALNNYKNFMKLLGGEEEQKRAGELIKRLTVVPDDVSDRFASLKELGKVCVDKFQIISLPISLVYNIVLSRCTFLFSDRGVELGVTNSLLVV